MAKWAAIGFVVIYFGLAVALGLITGFGVILIEEKQTEIQRANLMVLYNVEQEGH